MPLLETVLYGLLAGASALAAAAVIVVLRTEHTRRNGIAFAIGFLAAQLALVVLALVLGTESLPGGGSAHATVHATLEILLGLALLLAARRVRHGEPHVQREPRPLVAELRARQTAVLDRVGGLRPGAVLGTGALLGIGPKRLLLTVLAATGIAAAQVSRTGESALVTVFVLLATVLVWVPVLLALVYGARAGEWMATAQRWWADHRAVAIFVPLAGFGVFFLVGGVVDLVQA